MPMTTNVSKRAIFLRGDVLRRDLSLPRTRTAMVEAALKANESLPQVERIAAAMDRVFREAPVRIGERELVVGYRGCDGYPEIDAAVARGSAEYPYFIADFETLVRGGISAVVKRAEARLGPLDEADPTQMDSVHFLRAVVRSCNAVVAWANRYADEAERLASLEGDVARHRELQEIAARCRRVPEGPATSFADAVQSVWFLYVALYMETVAVSCLGRLDQYLYPLYAHDIETGAITRDGAAELLCCLWAKLYENVRGKIGSHAQTVTIGGLLPDGSSGANALSHLILDVAAQMGNVGAQIAVRWHDGQDPTLIARAVDLAAGGAIMPQVYNDHTYTSALQRLGVPPGDARQFAIFGCHEPVIAGMGYQRPASWPGYVSFYDWLEEALGLHSTGKPPILEVVGPPPTTADELRERWVRAMRHGVRRAVIAANHGDRIKRELLPRPLLSAFLRDCIDAGADLTAGGARYNMTGFQGCALATAVDSFNAVTDLVFEQRRVGMSELVAALQSDFAGCDSLRRLLLTTPPKYGRDDDAADSVAVRMVDAFCDEVEQHRNARGGRFTPGLWSFVQNVGFGSRTAASPDGRRAGAPISHSMDPVSGQALAGPTAVLRSAAKLAQTRLSNGGSLLLEFSASTLADPASRLAALALIEGYLRMSGIELQVSCASVERLLAAQRDPDSYRDMVVRVAGYSDFFVRQSPDLQRYIIEREKHAVRA